MKKTFFLTVFSLIIISSYAQRAWFEKEKILIGDQIKFTLEIPIDIGKNIVFPVLENQLIEGIEILEATEVLEDKKNKRLYREYLITSFEDSLFLLYPFEFQVDEKLIKTNPSRLQVVYIQPDSTLLSRIDTTQQIQIIDIKNPIDAPFTFKEFIHRFLLYFLIIAIIIIAYFAVKYILKQKKTGEPILIKAKPKIPAHIFAFEKLESLKKEELHKKTDLNPFYIRLSNIIRSYLEDRFKIPALESVTHEIMDDFRKTDYSNEDLNSKLTQLLSLSDTVKFAKNKPDDYENEMMFEYAFSFIDYTKEIENRKTTESQLVT